MEIVETTPQQFKFNLDKFELTVNGFTIALVGTHDEPWFPGKEICMTMRYKDTKSVLLKNVESKHKINLDELKKVHSLVTESQEILERFHWPFSKELSYHEAKAVYINKTGLRNLITKSKLAGNNHLITQLSDTFHLNLNVVHLTKEQETISAIMDVFPDFQAIQQFCVLNYRIDLYLPEVKLAIECDEFNHAMYDAEEERKREREIYQQLGCAFFRYDPDDKDFNIFCMLGELRQTIEKRLY
jgi:very-short-patch-repair endonuclease